MADPRGGRDSASVASRRCDATRCLYRVSRINARSTGTITQLHVPGGPFVRFDTFLVQDCSITPYYDSLLGKLIVWAANRQGEAVRKMRAALCELVIEGVETNIEEQLALISEQDFVLGTYDLRFMEGR